MIRLIYCRPATATDNEVAAKVQIDSVDWPVYKYTY